MKIIGEKTFSFRIIILHKKDLDEDYVAKTAFEVYIFDNLI